MANNQQRNKKLITLLIFDVDGTLVYSERRDSQCFAATYEQLYDRPFPTIDWNNYPHVTDTTILSTVIEQHFGRRPGREELLVFEEHYLALLGEKRLQNPVHSMEIPGARAMVERLLTNEDFLLGVATGGWQRSARLKLRHVRIPEEHMFIEGADGHTTRESILEAAVNLVRKHREFERIVYIGDAVWDVRTTRNLGVPFIGIRWQGDVDILLREGATQVLVNYLDQEAFLEAVARAEIARETKEQKNRGM